jgi:cell division protein FtsW
MIFQAMINMAVAVELLPVTGQTLPLISSGGTSIWMTCIALGIIIGVTKKEEEIEQEHKDAARREEALQKLIDEEIATDDKKAAMNYSIEDKVSNPMNAVLNKQ